MGKHTRKEFQELAGVSSQMISVYVKRKSLTPIWIGKRMYLDDKDPLNAAFIRKQQHNAIKKSSEQLPKIKEQKKKVIRYTEPINEEGDIVPAGNQKKIPFDKMNILEQKEHMQVEKLIEEVAIARIKKEKQQGLVIPTDIVINLFSTTFKSFVNEFYAASEDLGNIVIHGLGGNREDVIKFRASLIESINKSSKKSSELALKSIDGIVDEYSEKRGKGESK